MAHAAAAADGGGGGAGSWGQSGNFEKCTHLGIGYRPGCHGYHSDFSAVFYRSIV